MDNGIVELWRCVPSLLDACSCGDKATVGILRLVNKEASKVALLALRSHTLQLTSCNAYKAVSGASLLMGTHLQALTVHLLLSGDFSPAILLEVFVHEAGSSLHTLTSLALLIEDDWPTGSNATAAALSVAMSELVVACPALTAFTFHGHMCPAFLRIFGKMCPKLSNLTFICTNANHQNTHLKDMLLQQPSLLPHVTSLTFEHWTDQYELPDMSSNLSITSLKLNSFTFNSKEQWLCLPPNLKHLHCFEIDIGPPAQFDDSFQLSLLLTVEVDNDPATFFLHDFIQILRAAPNVQKIGPSQQAKTRSSCIHVCLFEATTAADLAIMLQRMELQSAKDVIYRVCGMPWKADTSLLSAIASLPMMRGVTTCQMVTLCPGDLCALLRLFPDIVELSLESCHTMTDIELQQLAACENLVMLSLDDCPKVNSVGLFAICQRLPRLCRLLCRDCALLNAAALEDFEKLLHMQGSTTRVEYLGEK